MTERRLPGNGNAITSEIDRLHELRQHLLDVARALESLPVPTWSGMAAEAFEGFRHRLREQWLQVAESHDEAARALDRYQRTRADLEARVQFGGQVSQDDIDRWFGQAAAEGDTAAAAIRRATDALERLPPMFDDGAGTTTAAPATAGPIPVVPRTEFAKLRASDPERAVDPRTGATDRVVYRDAVYKLVTEVFSAKFEPVSR